MIKEKRKFWPDICNLNIFLQPKNKKKIPKYYLLPKKGSFKNQQTQRDAANETCSTSSAEYINSSLLIYS